MLTNLLNYLLTFSIGIEILLIWLLLRQRNKPFFSSAYIYIVLLFAIDSLSTLLILNSRSVETSFIASKTSFIGTAFLIAVLYNATHLFSFTNVPPRLSIRNTFTFFIAFALSFGALFDLFIKDIQIIHGIHAPTYSVYYWLLVLFFLGIFYLIFINIISKYRLARRKNEMGYIRDILIVVLPLTFLSLFALHVLPFIGIAHPLINVSHFILAGLLLFSAFRFFILEADDFAFNLVPQIIIAGVVLLIFFLAFDVGTDLTMVLLSIPGFLIFAVAAQYISRNFNNVIKRFQNGTMDNPDQKMEEFSTNVAKFIDVNQLWQYIAKFIQENLHFRKIAFIRFQYDVSPYQLELISGFRSEDLQKLLSERDSPILDVLESDRNIINKFDYPDDSLVYQRMNALDIYLGVPLLKQNEILGIIFLGGDRKFARIPQKVLHFLKLISSQIAFAIDNIQTIQKTLQARKMAEIGMLASQLAHDFQSFISLVKLENRENKRLSDHASYTEKLVQDLLNYARPQDLQLSPININHLIDMSLDLVDLPQNIIIEKHYSDNLPEINVDLNQMRRVFTNLIENSNRAMKHTTSKRLKITTRPLRPISKVQRNPWIYIEILDEGVGIPDEFLDKIFDPFFTTHKNEGGNGMGLAIVKQIITRHHGFIDVTSRPGKGTVFNIRLPYWIG